MVFPILGANTESAAYEIENSLRFNEADDSKLVFDPADDDNKRTMTFSFWMKPAVGDYGGDHNNILSVRPSAGSYNMLVHRTGGEFLIEMNGTGDVLKTNRLFRDPSAWYHIVMAIDTTDGTASNRFKLYVNGTEETSFQTDQRSSVNQNTDMLWGGAQPHQIGGDPTGNYFYGGYLAEMHFVTGSQLAPSSFGETNDNGVWIPKKFAGSHGTNGFFLEFKQTGTSANASGIGADTSGGTNHFTSTNLAAIDVTVDTPTNNFATFNPIAVSRFSSGNAAVFAEGNCQIATQTSDNDRVLSVSTFGVTSGKWYWEVKAVVAAKCETGVVEANTVLGYSQHFNNESDPRGISIDTGGHIYAKGGGDYDDHENWAPDLNNNDIIMYALDMDNYELWHGINGTWSDSGDPTSGATGTGGIVNQSGNSYRTNLNHGDPMFPMVQDGSTGGQMKAQFNFGNSPFSISSGNADANGYGNFEYAVPSGFYSLCTKNLAEYG